MIQARQDASLPLESLLPLFTFEEIFRQDLDGDFSR